MKTNLITPFYDTFFDILGCVAGPMVFLSVCWGIYGIGDIETLGKIGKGMLLSFVGATFCASLGTVVLFPILGPGLTGSAEGGSQFQAILEMILDIFPPNIVEPFIQGNILQIIFLAVVIGIALLFLGRKTKSIAVAIEQVNLLVQFLMYAVSKIVPFIIFLVIIKLIWSGATANLHSVWLLLGVIVGAHLLIALIFLVITSLRQKVKASILLKKAMPAFLVALSSASSAAAFSMNVETCEKKYGINNAVASFGIPLGMVIHKPVAAMYNLILVFYFASVYQVKCSLAWLVLAVFISAVISIATPPVPGGGAVAYAALFGQLGIPIEAMTIVLTIDIVTDFVITAFEVFNLQMTMINVSSRMGLIDKKILTEQ